MSRPTLVFALEEPPVSYSRSIFLAGPTTRSDGLTEWRRQAISLLQDFGYDGVIFIPEDRSGVWHGKWEEQVKWEERCLASADCVLFWVDRDMKVLPGLTTNIEFGRLEDTGRIVLGTPNDSPGSRYLLHYCSVNAIPSANSLIDTLELALDMVGAGALRIGGECDVPLNIWRTPAFQSWYGFLQAAGNRLDGARQLWSFRVGPQKQFLLYWAMQVDIYVAAEGRNKSNEVMLARQDISSVVMYRRAASVYDSEIVLVREFRSPVANNSGYVYEVPGGSSFKPGGNPRQLAADEVSEETGVDISPSRIRQHDARQLTATLSAHRAHLFSVALTEDEIDMIRGMAGQAHGVEEDSERTYIEVMKLGDILRNPDIDWSMLGMMMSVLFDD